MYISVLLAKNVDAKFTFLCLIVQSEAISQGVIKSFGAHIMSCAKTLPVLL